VIYALCDENDRGVPRLLAGGIGTLGEVFIRELYRIIKELNNLMLRTHSSKKMLSLKGFSARWDNTV
jgi:hypothetical protein